MCKLVSHSHRVSQYFFILIWAGLASYCSAATRTVWSHHTSYYIMCESVLATSKMRVHKNSRCLIFFCQPMAAFKSPIEFYTNFIKLQIHNSHLLGFWSETSLGWFGGEWNGNCHAYSALSNPKIMVLFNINFAPPFHQTRQIQWEGEQIFVFFSFWKGFMGIISVVNHADSSAHAQIVENTGILKIFSYFCLWKNGNKMRVYIIWTHKRNFSWNFLIFFQKLPSAYIFINCTNLWKLVIIVFNTYLNFIKLSNTSAIFWKASIKFE